MLLRVKATSSALGHPEVVMPMQSQDSHWWQRNWPELPKAWPWHLGATVGGQPGSGRASPWPAAQVSNWLCLNPSVMCGWGCFLWIL